jgi:hypothetical protein
MTEYPARRDPKRPPMHPGALLREDVLPVLGRDNKTEIESSRVHCSRQAHNFSNRNSFAAISTK